MENQEEIFQEHLERYNFEHKTLPTLLYSITAKTSEELLQYIDFVWSRAKEIMSEWEEACPEFEHHIVNLDDSTTLYWVKMPEPEFPTNCFEICMAFNPKRPNKRFYYTIESSLDNKISVCGWKRKPYHVNFMNVNNVEDGRKLIEELAKNKLLRLLLW